MLSLLLLACTDPDTAGPRAADTGAAPLAVALLDAPATLHADRLSDSATHAVPTAPGQVLLSGEAVWLSDARDEAAEEIDGAAGPVRAAAWASEVLLLSTPAGLRTWDGALWGSPLSEHVTGSVEQLAVDGDRLWLRTADSLYRWSGGVVEAIQLGGAPTGLATGGLLGDAAVTWVGAGPVAVALSEADAVSAERAFRDLWQLGTDAAGNAWLNDGGSLWVHLSGAEDWAQIPLGAACTDLLASPQTATIWAATTTGAHVGSAAAGLQPAEVGGDGWLAVDSRGRLLHTDGSGVLRTSAGRGVGWLDLPERIEEEQVATLHPSTEDGIASISVTLDGEPVEGRAVAFHPADFEEGVEKILAAEVQWTDGSAAALEVAVLGALGTVTWDDTIAPLYEDRCAQCHGGDADTVLDSAAAWQDLIDDIIDQVARGAMPLGSDPLSQDDVDRIRAWRDAGFPLTEPR